MVGSDEGYGTMGVDPPDWRTTCFFVDRDHRREGVAKAALEGALRFITAKGGGTVDGYPTESMYLDLGFRPLGSFGTSERVMVMRKVVHSR